MLYQIQLLLWVDFKMITLIALRFLFRDFVLNKAKIFWRNKRNHFFIMMITSIDPSSSLINLHLRLILTFFTELITLILNYIF